MKTAIVTTTAMPRQGAGGIGRSNSSGGPPWICSSRMCLRKNIRGRRSLSLKLEINEGITGSLSENNSARHHRADGSDRPCWQAHYSGFKAVLAHRPVQRDDTGGDDSDLEQFAGGKNHVAMLVLTEHASEHSTGHG